MDTRQEDGTLKWQSTSTQKETESTLSTCRNPLVMVDDAYKAVSDIAAEGGTILFVGTKKQAQDAIKVRS